MKREKKLTIPELAEIIRANPGCVATIDNDCWWIDRESYEDAPDEDDDGEAYDEWERNNRLVSSDDVDDCNGGYGSGSTYGGDVLQALAHIVGITVESV